MYVELGMRCSNERKAFCGTSSKVAFSTISCTLGALFDTQSGSLTRCTFGGEPCEVPQGHSRTNGTVKAAPRPTLIPTHTSTSRRGEEKRLCRRCLVSKGAICIPHEPTPHDGSRLRPPKTSRPYNVLSGPQFHHDAANVRHVRLMTWMLLSTSIS